MAEDFASGFSEMMKFQFALAEQRRRADQIERIQLENLKIQKDRAALTEKLAKTELADREQKNALASAMLQLQFGADVPSPSAGPVGKVPLSDFSPTEGTTPPDVSGETGSVGASLGGLDPQGLKTGILAQGLNAQGPTAPGAVDIPLPAGGSFAVTPGQFRERQARPKLQELMLKAFFDRQAQQATIPGAIGEQFGLEGDTTVDKSVVSIIPQIGDQERKKKADVRAEATTANTLSNSFERLSRDFFQVEDNYSKLLAADTNTPAGQVSLVYNFIKMIDPGAAIQEGDKANVTQASPVTRQLFNTYNALIEGTKIDPDTVRNFIDEAGRIHTVARERQSGLNELFSARAREAGIDPSRVVRTTKQPTRLQSSGPVTLTLPSGRTVTFPNQKAADEAKKRLGIQ